MHPLLNLQCSRIWYPHAGKSPFQIEELQLLEKRRWTAYRLAKESGIHPSVLSKYVNNQVREISLDTLNALCEALTCRAGDLIEYVPDSKQKARK